MANPNPQPPVARSRLGSRRTKGSNTRSRSSGAIPGPSSSTRSVARGIVAKLVAQGARNTHEWTPEKNELLAAYDAAGITTAFMDPHQGGFIEGPKNLVLSLICYELAWVDAGAATGSLAGNLALSPIHERGTQEQQDRYMGLAAPARPLARV